MWEECCGTAERAAVLGKRAAPRASFVFVTLAPLCQFHIRRCKTLVSYVSDSRNVSGALVELSLSIGVEEIVAAGKKS